MSKETITIDREFLVKHLSLLSRAGLMFTGVVGIIDSIDELREIVDKSVCKKCNGTGEMDTGGFTPWGADITVTCDCVAMHNEEVGDTLQNRLTDAEKRAGELEGLLQMFIDNSDDRDVVELSRHALKPVEGEGS